MARSRGRASTRATGALALLLFAPPPADARAAEPAVGPYRPGLRGLRVPQLIHESRVDPVTPPGAAWRDDCFVVLQAVIRRDGTVGAVTPENVCVQDQGFEEAAAEAVRQWRYRPGTLHGEPVDVVIDIALEVRPADVSRTTELLREEYVGRYLLLREDVKVRRRQQTTIGGNPNAVGISGSFDPDVQTSNEESSGATVVTASGVSYRSDYEATEMFVRPAPKTRDVMEERQKNPYNPYPESVWTDDVAIDEVTVAVHVALRRGEITRIVDLREAPNGILAELEWRAGRTVPVLFVGLPPDAPLPDRVAEFRALAAALFESTDSAEGAGTPEAAFASEDAAAAGITPGMTPKQVLQAWGEPLHVSRKEDGSEIWLYTRGGTLLQPHGFNVRFAGGRVVRLERLTGW